MTLARGSPNIRHAGLPDRENFTVRIDGFCSSGAGTQEGSLTTPALLYSAGQLQVNGEAKPGGGLDIGILDADGPAIPGSARGEWATLSGDRIDHPVPWRSGSSLRQLAGRPVRLRFHLRQTDLSSFRPLTDRPYIRMERARPCTFPYS